MARTFQDFPAIDAACIDSGRWMPGVEIAGPGGGQRHYRLAWRRLAWRCLAWRRLARKSWPGCRLRRRGCPLQLGQGSGGGTALDGVRDAIIECSGASPPGLVLDQCARRAELRPGRVADGGGGIDDAHHDGGAKEQTHRKVSATAAVWPFGVNDRSRVRPGGRGGLGESKPDVAPRFGNALFTLFPGFRRWPAVMAPRGPLARLGRRKSASCLGFV